MGTKLFLIFLFFTTLSFAQAEKIELEAETIARKVISSLDMVGLLAVEMFVTKTGELSVHVQKLQFLSKALLPMPDKVRAEAGNVLRDIQVRFDVRFPDGEHGDAARDVLPEAVRRSHDRLCTVSRTVELGTPIEVVVERVLDAASLQ